ncbi:sll0787 family AIR synthase-like protein [Ideonella sp. YS5]|uniref:sll0787 family AIR synthase-like protein n=1 Tax=Ideonella sp. YS5 TaxID=3453714 RepID=UPI003EED13CE
MSTDLQALCDALRASRGFAHKRDIGAVLGRLGPQTTGTSLPNGDDCAVLPEPGGSGHLLLAIEGLVADFVQAMPWFAGYSAVMVNLSDIAAMGGRPIAVVDALWSAEAAVAAEVIDGMQAAAARYGVPLVGGHTNLRAAQAQLAVAVLGRANALISSFAALPGDRLLMAVDLRGRWMDPFPFWNASTEAPPQRLRDDLALLPELAEQGLLGAGKDISMAGVLGTLLMLCECSGVGARVDLSRLPRPAATVDGDGDALLRWLCAFPSFGYLLAVPAGRAGAVRARFAARDIACADIGEIVAGSQVSVGDGAGDERQLLWDFADAGFITGAAREPGR